MAKKFVQTVLNAGCCGFTGEGHAKTVCGIPKDLFLLRSGGAGDGKRGGLLMFSRKHFLSAFLCTVCIGCAVGLFAGAAVYFVVCGILGVVALGGLWLDSWRQSKVVGGFSGMFFGAIVGYGGAIGVDRLVMESVKDSAVDFIPALEQFHKEHGVYPGKLSDLPQSRAASAYITYYATSDSFTFRIHRVGMFLDVWEWRSEDRTWRES